MTTMQKARRGFRWVTSPSQRSRMRAVETFYINAALEEFERWQKAWDREDITITIVTTAG